MEARAPSRYPETRRILVGDEQNERCGIACTGAGIVRLYRAPDSSARAKPRGTTRMTRANELADPVRTQMAKAIVGQREPLDHVFLVLFIRGHALIEAVPLLAKTLAVK